MMVSPNTPYDGGHPKRTNIRHFSHAVDQLVMPSAVALPMRTRQRLLFVVIGILLSRTFVLHRSAIPHAYLTLQTTCAASHERRLRRVLNDPLLTWERSDARLVRRFLACETARCWGVISAELAPVEYLRVVTAVRWHRGRAIPLA